MYISINEVGRIGKK